MLFVEPTFLFLFLPLLLWAYWCAPVGMRNLLLTIASLFCYAAGQPHHLLLMVCSILLNYLAGLAVGSGTPTAKKWWMVLAVVGNLGVLVAFKYTGFLVENLNVLTATLGLDPLTVPRVGLPVGISFFTFQAMSYVIDVYRGRVEPQRRVLDLALYISFFPQLIAGPIVRYTDVARQLISRRLTGRLFESGVRRFIIGLAKKMILANAVAGPSDQIFALPADELTTPIAWLGIVCYSLQIYFDFSGYSDMAIGLGRMFGFRFPENFRFPYAASSVTDFWRRWHISLSSWFRDYLYIPLGGNRGSVLRTYCNLFIVFVLCGLWHGASWLFIAWGMWHGGLLVLERLGLSSLLNRTWRPVRHGYTLLAVMGGWGLFRIATGPTMRPEPMLFAGQYFTTLCGFGAVDSVRSLPEFFTSYTLCVLSVAMLCAVPISVCRIVAQLSRMTQSELRRRSSWRNAVQFGSNAGLLAALAWSVMLMSADLYNPFIYFQF